MVWFIIIIVLILALGIAVAIYLHKKKAKQITLQSLGLRLLLIKIHRDEDDDERKDVKEEINYSEQLFAALLSLGEPFVFEVSVHHVGREIFFYAAVPEGRVDFTARQIQGLFPDSQVEEVNDYNIFAPHGAHAGGYFALKESHILPIRTYQESEVDTFSQILSSMSKLHESGEGASIQMIVHPTGDYAKKNILSAIDELKKGEKFSDVLKRTKLVSGKDVKDMFSKGKDASAPSIIDEEAIKTLQTKVNKPLFNVNVRIITSAADHDRAEDIFTTIAGSYSQFTAPLRNEMLIIKPKNLKKLLYKYSFREYDNRTNFTLNSEEIASIFHLPTFTSDVPNINWLKSRESAPPNNLGNEGVVIGESTYRGERKQVYLSTKDRRRHLYMIGQTGTGKSFGMLDMVVQDMQAGHGVCVIDPHGELVSNILERVPEGRADDVIVFDPGDISRPLGLNMLEYDLDHPEHITFIVNEIQAIFNRLFSKETMGPMFEQYMRNTLKLLMGDFKHEPATLMEVPRIMVDEAYRREKISRCKDPMVVDFWEKEASKTSGETSLANMTPYITTKFGNFTANDYLRPIIGQPKSAFDFREVMDNRKILLVNLAKGKIGDINANLLGMIITGRILMAALGRTDMDESARKDFYFYIDEFQNFTTDSISTILSEARKYRLNLILAHQYIDQLPDDIRDSVFGNVGSMMALRVGVPDTEMLVKQFQPEFSAKDLISIDNQKAIAKILINGEPARPFNIATRFVNPGSGMIREKITELSRLTYGREHAEVEREILERLRRKSDPPPPAVPPRPRIPTPGIPRRPMPPRVPPVTPPNPVPNPSQQTPPPPQPVSPPTIPPANNDDELKY